MARSNPLTWRNIGQPSFTSGAGMGVAARAFASAGEGFRKAADYARDRRTDRALADLMADGEITRDELGSLNTRGLDMKTILDAQRLDQTTREQSASRSISDALNQERVNELKHTNSPEERKRVADEAAARLKIAQQNANRLESMANLASTEAELAEENRERYKSAEELFDSGWRSYVADARNVGGALHLGTAIKDFTEERKRRNLPPLTKGQMDKWLEKWNTAEAQRKRALRNDYLQDFSINQPAQARILDQTPDFEGYNKRIEKIDELIAASEVERQKQQSEQVDRLKTDGADFISIGANEAGGLTYTPTDRSRRVKGEGAIEDAANVMLENFNLDPDKSASHVTWDWKTSDSSKLNIDGMRDLFKAARGHPDIVAQVLREFRGVDVNKFKDDQYYVDWSKASRRASEILRLADDHAAQLNRNYYEDLLR